MLASRMESDSQAVRARSSTNSEHQRPQTGIKPLVCNISYNKPQHIVHNNQKADDGNITAQSLTLIIRPILQTNPLNPPTHAKRSNTVHNTITTKKKNHINHPSLLSKLS